MKLYWILNAKSKYSIDFGGHLCARAIGKSFGGLFNEVLFDDCRA